MAIIAPQTAPNFSTGDYHRILSAKLLCSPDEPVPRWQYMVGFYASAAARDQAPGFPMWTSNVFVTIESIIAAGGVDPRDMMYAQVMADPMFNGTNAASDHTVDDSPGTGQLVPAKVTRRAARQALLLAGKLDAVQPAIDAIEDAQAKAMAQIYWDDSSEFERSLPLLIQLAHAIGLDDAGIDQLFIAAASL